MIPATVGRIVWFQSTNTDEPLPAVVVRVHGPSMISVRVFDTSDHYESSVPLMQEEDDPIKFTTRYCRWMPYQIAVAKK